MMKLKAMLIEVGRFLGLVLLLEIALLAIVGVAAFLLGARTWPDFGTWLFYAGAAAIIAGWLPSAGSMAAINRPVERTQELYSTRQLIAERYSTSARAMNLVLLAALVGGMAIALGMLLAGA